MNPFTRKKHPTMTNKTAKHFFNITGDKACAAFAPNFAVMKLMILMPMKA
jgi:hypothetical protein